MHTNIILLPQSEVYWLTCTRIRCTGGCSLVATNKPSTSLPWPGGLRECFLCLGFLWMQSIHNFIFIDIITTIDLDLSEGKIIRRISQHIPYPCIDVSISSLDDIGNIGFAGRIQHSHSHWGRLGALVSIRTRVDVD